MYFTGEFLNKFDEAGRISLPAKMRDELRLNGHSDSLMVYFAYKTQCLRILPKSEFAKIADEYKQNPPKTQEKMMSYRALFSSALPCEINGSGRISISSNHRKLANLGEDCYIIGMIDKIELWNKDAWEEQNRKFSEILSQSDDEQDLTVF